MSKNNDEQLITNEQATQVVKKKLSKYSQELSAETHDLPGENARMFRHALVAFNLPPIDISDPKQVEARCNEYFHYCLENDLRPQIVSLCNWIGISRMGFNKWKNGEVRSETHMELVQRIYGVMEEMWTNYMSYGKISPPTAIFLAKNWFGYKDIADVVVTPQNPYETASKEELAKKYLTGAIDNDDNDDN